MRTVKAIHTAVYEPIADLVTYRAMPTPTLPMNALDPFIFLNHHGPQHYPPHNNGLPFGPHPHRGFETVTFILEGDLVHKDSSGSESVIGAGGVQWMVAGRGLIHNEISSEEFKEKGGLLEILQLWINLPAKYKMREPYYAGLQQEDIPAVRLDGENAIAHLVFGTWDGMVAPFKPFTDIHLAQINYAPQGDTSFTIGKEKNIFCYIVKGSLQINNVQVEQHQLVEFNHDDDQVRITADAQSVILLGHATPFREAFVAYGPFVMNTQEEILQAYEDYSKGKFGKVDAF